MPEMPDIEAYLEALKPRILGKTLLGIRLQSPFLLRTVDPPLAALPGGRVEGLARLGKRIVIRLTPPRTVSAGSNGPWFLVLHLMVAGRLHWRSAGAALAKGSGLAAFDFPDGTLVLTEAGKKRRASLHLVKDDAALAELDPGGLEPLDASEAEFDVALRKENRTLKRVLTDQRVLSGIGNAYSDEILHRARLSPFARTQKLGSEEMGRLRSATADVLQEWTDRLREEARKEFPEKVTAFRPEMAVHGRFGQPCPVCGAQIQRIVYSENECDYCPGCQTGGRILADRALSRLLKDDWPRSLPGDG